MSILRSAPVGWILDKMTDLSSQAPDLKEARRINVDGFIFRGELTECGRSVQQPVNPLFCSSCDGERTEKCGCARKSAISANLQISDQASDFPAQVKITRPRSA